MPNNSNSELPPPPPPPSISLRRSWAATPQDLPLPPPPSPPQTAKEGAPAQTQALLPAPSALRYIPTTATASVPVVSTPSPAIPIARETDKNIHPALQSAVSQTLAQSAPQAPPSRFYIRLYKFGLGGFMTSLIVHIVLVLIAIFIVMSTTTTFNLEEKFELPGGGGGSGGDTPREYRVAQAQRRDRQRVLSKIRVAAPAKVVLPEILDEDKKLIASMSNFKGSASSGSGGGLGGGIGIGKGIGIGRGSGPGFGGGYGRTFVGRPVLGLFIRGEKIAVYLDNSQSLVPYLGIVKKLIYEKFPSADIFELPGAKTTIVENAILGGKHSAVGASAAESYGKGSRTNYAKLTAYGRKVYTQYGPNFARGSVGAWVDVMLYEEYDAIVVFSDFQDGFNDDGWMPPGATEKWKERWLAQFKKAKQTQRGSAKKEHAPRLYLVSVQLPPQQEWQEFVEASGGEITLKDVQTRGAAILSNR